MFNAFRNYIQTNNLIAKADRLLVAVSGGIDSVVMAHLLSKLGCQMAIAHCNFNLRGSESDGDEQFVYQLAQKFNCPVYVESFDTNTYASSKKLSVQMAARELRYNWFKNLLNQHAYTKLCIAHNKNDIAETMLINLSRGTGIKGLTGIKNKIGQTIRPLLFATRSQIAAFAQEHNIAYREDSSNTNTKYLRNMIRHQVVPLFEQTNPSFLDTITQTAEILEETEKTHAQYISGLKNKLFISQDNDIYIKTSNLVNLSAAIIFDLLSQFNINYSTAKDLKKALPQQAGKKFFTPGYVIIKDRSDIIITPIGINSNQAEYLISAPNASPQLPIKLNMVVTDWGAQKKVVKSNTVAQLDFNLLQFPLVLRKWQHGDFFYPLGMTGKKKLSDFFVDRKLSLPDKKRVWVLLSGQDIAWVVDYQIDNRFKITNNTSKILEITYNKE